MIQRQEKSYSSKYDTRILQPTNHRNYNQFINSRNMEWQQPHPQAEEEFQYEPYLELPLTLDRPIQYSTDLLIIAQYGPSSLFAHSLVGPQAIVNRLNFSKAKQCALADLYEQNGGRTLILIFNDSLQPMKEVFFARFVQKNFRSKQIVVLLAVSKKTLKDAYLPPLTHISTSAAAPVNFPKFEQGITGLSADVLAWGEANRVPVYGFIASFGEYQLSSNIVQQNFGALRGKYGLCGHLDIGQHVKKFNMKNYSSRLYL